MGRNTMRNSVNNAMRQKLFSEYLNDKKTMNTTENNKLIAEFMGGWKLKEKHFVIETPFFKSLGGCIFAPSELQFHSDWNWLMEVVEKIENSIVNGTLNGVIVTMGKNLNHKQYCYIEWGNTNNVRNGQRNLSGFYSKTIEAEKLIEAVYNAVVEFIKWYNRQTLIAKIDSGEIDTDDLKAEFNETLYSKGYDFETVTEYTDEHFENLLSFEENEEKFIKWYNQQK